MKLKDGFILREVAGKTVVLPTGGDLDLNMMITLNGTAKFLWEKLQNDIDEAGLVAALLATYEVDEETATTCVAEFVAKLKENDFLI
ncbi:MAG: PqqD family protein [Oscillospiraceae bacterium]|nr:PqqD family protein [Oscillospiraceae bacterium]